MDLIDAVRSHVMVLPDLAKFAVVVAAIVGFVVTGLVIDPVVFATDVVDHFGLAGLGDRRGFTRGKVDRRGGRGSPFRLHAGRKVDDVGADFAAGGRNPGRRSGRLRHAQRGWATNAG